MMGRVFRNAEVRIKLPLEEDPSKWEEQTVTAVFHSWGFRQPKGGIPQEKPGGCESVGIVEIAGGAIRLVRPEKIKFLPGVRKFEEVVQP